MSTQIQFFFSYFLSNQANSQCLNCENIAFFITNYQQLGPLKQEKNKFNLHPQLFLSIHEISVNCKVFKSKCHIGNVIVYQFKGHIENALFEHFLNVHYNIGNISTTIFYKKIFYYKLFFYYFKFYIYLKKLILK